MPTVAELLDALPQDSSIDVDGAERTPAPAEFVRTLGHVSLRPVPVGSLRRLWSLGSLQAKIGVAYGVWWIRKYFRNADKNQQALLETHLRSALEILETMGYLRGAVMKIGQMAANLPEVVPDQFVDTLSRLHFEAPAMHYSLIREHLYDELGGDPEDVFDEFEKDAFAAASLGQVHRARLKSGERVAVKIQYPGIARTIRSDFRNLFAVLTPLRFSSEWENLKSQLEELRTVLEWETDYEREARSLETIRALFAEDDGIVVPRVHRQYSTRRVLTMDLIEGRTIDEFLATAPEPVERNEFGKKVCRACCRVLYRARMQYADPHPGNFLFLDDGRLGFLDFGCMREWNDREWEYLRLADQALRDGSREAIVAHIRRGVELTEEQMNDPVLMDLMVEYCRWIWEPFMLDVDYDCGDPEYIRRGCDIIAEFTKRARPAQKPENVFIQRSFWAGWGVHFRLQSRFNPRKIMDEESRAAGWAHIA